jgi:hypothetical protein
MRYEKYSMPRIRANVYDNSHFAKFHNIYIILKLKGVKNVDEGVYWDIIKLKG